MSNISRIIRKITTFFLSVFLVLNVIGVCEISAEDFSLTTNKTSYKMNEPIIVTAKGGKWVGVYKKGETPSETQGYFYRFDVDGEPHNIYSESGKGVRGATFVATIPGKMTVRIYLFGDEGYDNILATQDITITKETEESFLSVPETTNVGETIQIESKSFNRDAWVGIYRGIYTSSDTFSDNYLEKYYQAFVNNEGKDIEGLNAGKYTAVLFYNSQNNSYTVDKLVNFEVVSDEPVEPLISTDKTEYDINDPIMVTSKPDGAKDWVGLYKKGETPSSGTESIYWFYSMSHDNPYNLLSEGNEGSRAGEFGAGEYTVFLLANDGYSVMASKDITVTNSVENSITLNKEGTIPDYKYGEPVLVSGTCGNRKAWIGLYDVTPEDLTKYYTYFNLKDVTEPVDIVGKALEEGKKLEPGKTYRVYVFEPTASNPYEIARYENGNFVTKKFNILETYYDDDEHIDYALSEDKVSATVTFHRVDDETKTAEFTTEDVTLTEKVEAKCEEAGSETYTISFNFPEGEELATVNDKTEFTSTKTVELSALGHDWSDWTLDPEQSGMEKRTCGRCEETERREVAEHDHAEHLIHHEAKAAKCEEDGNIEYWVCELCQRYYSDANAENEINPGEEITKAIGHAYGGWQFDEVNHKHYKECANDSSHKIVEDCNFEHVINNGKITFTCDICDGSFTETILSTDYPEYKQGQPIKVTVNLDAIRGVVDGINDEAWVGFYPKNEHPAPDMSIRWYYVKDNEVSYNIYDGEGGTNGRDGLIGEGDFEIYLLKDGGYDGDITHITIHITDEEMEMGDFTFSVDGEEKNDKERTEVIVPVSEVKIKGVVDGFEGNSWIGFYSGEYDKDYDFSTLSTEDNWWWLKDFNGQEIDITSLVQDAGTYTLVIFGNSKHDKVKQINYIDVVRKVDHDETTQEPTCTEPGKKTVYYTDGTTEETAIPALGHDWSEWKHDEGAETHSRKCSRCEENEKEDCTYSKDPVHIDDSWVYTCDVCGGEKKAPYHTFDENIVRVYGDTRFGTSGAISDVMLNKLNIEKYDTVILACSDNFADALSGSALAAAKNAPILIINDKSAADVEKKISEILKDNGQIYILGGTKAVSEKIEKDLSAYTVRRLYGPTRYETNLKILEAVGNNSDTILISTGSNYADSLSASATGLPILLVGDSLSKDQKKYLEANKGKKLYILGGEKAVSAKLESELGAYGMIKRLYGNTRYETTIKIAEEFFPNADTALVAYGGAFPDGLCGGPLAYTMHAPIILTVSGSTASAGEFVSSKNIAVGAILGGTARLTDNDIRQIYGLDDDTEIIEYKN